MRRLGSPAKPLPERPKRIRRLPDRLRSTAAKLPGRPGPQPIIIIIIITTIVSNNIMNYGYCYYHTLLTLRVASPGGRGLGGEGKNRGDGTRLAK